MTRFPLAAALYIASAAASACTCPLYTQAWWDRAHNVALVRLDAAGVAARSAPDSGPCVKGESCFLNQKGSFTLVETFKGSLAQVRNLYSGYGSGDCGMPLVAGAYYVVFLLEASSQVGFCNAAGPYPMYYPFKGRYPEHLEPFVSSLRRAATDPDAKVAARPAPMTYDTLGGL